MDLEGTFKSRIFTGLLPVFLALPISTGALLQFRAPSDESLNLSLLFMATLTFFLGMTLLPLCLVMRSTKSPNPTFTRLTAHLATVTLIASLSTLLLALPDDQTSPAFTNPTIFYHWSVAWASQCGLILFAIAMLYSLIDEIPTSRFQHCTKVVVFTLCVSLAGLYTEPVFSPHITVPALYRIYQCALVPFTFALGAILLILGVAVPNNSTCSCISAIFKEVFATLTLSVACITLLIGAFVKVGAM